MILVVTAPTARGVYQMPPSSASKFPILPVASATSLWGGQNFWLQARGLKDTLLASKEKTMSWTPGTHDPSFATLGLVLRGPPPSKIEVIIWVPGISTLLVLWRDAWMDSLQTPFLHLEHCSFQLQDPSWGLKIEAPDFWRSKHKNGTKFLCISLGFQTPWGWRYLDPKKHT